MIRTYLWHILLIFQAYKIHIRLKLVHQNHNQILQSGIYIYLICRLCSYYGKFLINKLIQLNHNPIYCGLALSVRAFTSHAESWVFKSRLRQTKVIKTGSYRSTAKGNRCVVPRFLGDDFYERTSRVTVGTLKNTHCSKVMSAQLRSKFAAHHR